MCDDNVKPAPKDARGHVSFRVEEINKLIALWETSARIAYEEAGRSLGKKWKDRDVSPVRSAAQGEIYEYCAQGLKGLMIAECMRGLGDTEDV